MNIHLNQLNFVPTNYAMHPWSYNFHKVVRQQNSSAVEDFILPYSAVYLRIQK